MLLAILAVLQQPAAAPAAPSPAAPSCVILDRLRDPAQTAPAPVGGMLEQVEVLVMHDGVLLALLERVGHNFQSLGVDLFRSTDRGEHWLRLQSLPSLAGASLFERENGLFLIGSDEGPIVRCSEDHGETWSMPKNAVSGRISTARLSGCSSPVEVCAGRIWKVFARCDATSVSSVLVGSAAVGDDLLRAENWSWSTELGAAPWNRQPLGRSRLYSGEDHAPQLIVDAGGEWVDTSRPSEKGLRLQAPDPRPAWRGCGALGTRLLVDRARGLTLALAAFPDSTRPPLPPASLASEVDLMGTRDLAAWDVRTVLLRGDSGARFDCADWAIDGEDLVAVIGGNLGETADSRALLFLRVPAFRARKFADAPARAPGG